MFKSILRRKNDANDMRFVKYEVYRAMSEKRVGRATKNLTHQSVPKSKISKVTSLKVDPLEVDFVSQESSICTAQYKAIFKRQSERLRLAKNATEESPKSKELYNESLFPFDTLQLKSCQRKPVSSNSLGIFSDTKIYSAFIKYEIDNYELNLKHFNHPRTFQPNNYSLFDSISAWMVFLSDSCDSDFLDAFIERYVDKPTLFLCPKTKRETTTHKINQFVSSL